MARALTHTRFALSPTAPKMPVSPWGPPHAHGVSGISYGEVRNTLYAHGVSGIPYGEVCDTHGGMRLVNAHDIVRIEIPSKWLRETNKGCNLLYQSLVLVLALGQKVRHHTCG